MKTLRKLSSCTHIFEDKHVQKMFAIKVLKVESVDSEHDRKRSASMSDVLKSSKENYERLATEVV